MLTNQPTFIEKGRVKCVIMDAPSDANVAAYLKVLQGYGIRAIVRTCESTYEKTFFEQHGVLVHEIPFPDGDPPSTDVITEFLGVVDGVLEQKAGFAVQCVAGLGRAPVLAAIALIEREGMDPMDVISLIRKNRKGAINARQVKFLETYKPLPKTGGKNCCVVS
jgi:protein tyrosine phosphatase type 4A